MLCAVPWDIRPLFILLTVFHTINMVVHEKRWQHLFLPSIQRARAAVAHNPYDGALGAETNFAALTFPIDYSATLRWCHHFSYVSASSSCVPPTPPHESFISPTPPFLAVEDALPQPPIQLGGNHKIIGVRVMSQATTPSAVFATTLLLYVLRRFSHRQLREGVCGTL